MSTLADIIRENYTRKQFEEASGPIVLDYRWEFKGSMRGMVQLEFGDIRSQVGEEVVMDPDRARKILVDEAVALDRFLQKWAPGFAEDIVGYYLKGERQHEVCFGPLIERSVTPKHSRSPSIYKYDVKDPAYIDELARCFLDNKIRPYLESTGIDPLKEYSISEAAGIIQVKKPTLRRAVEYGVVPDTEFRDLMDTNIKGIQLAVYVLRRTAQRVFSLSQVAELFGAEEIDVEKLGVQTTEKLKVNTYKLAPAYYAIAARAVEMLKGCQ